MSLREQITSDMKSAMRAHEAEKLATIRMLLAAIKQKEVDERVTLEDQDITGIISKLIKQRKDSAKMYLEGGRPELADKENAEIAVLTAYLPKQLSEEEIRGIVDAVIEKLGVSGMAAMGKVMGAVKPQLAGKADMSKVSAIIKAKLTA